jgi:Ni,Fe-hydrogenase III small subunit
VGSLSVGVAFFTHINETLDSDQFEEYFETKPEENDVTVIIKAILANNIMYYRYFKAMPDPLLSML